jgi:hypothetical protein
MPAGTTPVAAAVDAAGVSARELAVLLEISEPAAWDILTQAHELSMCLSLRQLLRLATRLGTSPLSLLPEPAVPARDHRPLTQLAAEVRAYCALHHIGAEQFSEQAGWDIRQFLATPDSAFDDWCLDALIDICHTLGLHWPDYLPE